MTNVLILLLLKGLLWGASYASTTNYPKSRSGDADDSSRFLTETEILLLLSYLVGDEENNNFDCLHRVACEDPEKTREYTNAASVLMKAADYLGM